MENMSEKEEEGVEGKSKKGTSNLVFRQERMPDWIIKPPRRGLLGPQVLHFLYEEQRKNGLAKAQEKQLSPPLPPFSHLIFPNIRLIPSPTNLVLCSPSLVPVTAAASLADGADPSDLPYRKRDPGDTPRSRQR